MHENDGKYFQELLKRYERGQATEAEIRFVEAYFDYLDKTKHSDPFASMKAGEKDNLKDEMYAELLQQLRSANVVEMLPRRRFGWKWQVAAAVLLIACSVVGYRYFFKADQKVDVTTVAFSDDPVPQHTDRAILKMADGKEIMLDSAHGKIVQQNGLSIDNENGKLNYDVSTKAPELHTLYTPRGTQYELQLPDGTHVWLNTASSITYPTVFTDGKREVTITGEAYFEVAKNKELPFIVKANDQQIEVTGTHFNINAYSDEPYPVTTLLEGGVKVSSNNSMVKLVPGEQSSTGSNGELTVKKGINTEEVMAWKNGFFHFESADLPTILRQLSRWYDLTVTYEGPAPKDKFFVIIKRNSTLSAVIKALQANGNVQLAIEGRNLKVKAID
ncbi:FecR family protein [Pseudoflavitalea sp. G-6-1-2]|uniref:FecR family protein n=1 Tax=Pseudoflavitalea sp. G-6-1-2 TaxID=2728841 RepID=UPI00146E1023|nr:FecR family protein [Pseudoflavitalea sp. G-6-1-2]NML21681.1 FecR family protein [Pseudoflavitalea sp. G-6-1-2]